MGWERIANGQGRKEAAKVQRPISATLFLHRVGVSPSSWEPWREWHIGMARGGVLPAPSVSCCCCCSQFCGSCEFSEPSRPFCHPQELESSQDSLEEPLPPELGVPSQTRWESDGGGGGRGDPHGWPPSG